MRIRTTDRDLAMVHLPLTFVFLLWVMYSAHQPDFFDMTTAVPLIEQVPLAR